MAQGPVTASGAPAFAGPSSLVWLALVAAAAAAVAVGAPRRKQFLVTGVQFSDANLRILRATEKTPLFSTDSTVFTYGGDDKGPEKGLYSGMHPLSPEGTDRN